MWDPAEVDYRPIVNPPNTPFEERFLAAVRASGPRSPDAAPVARPRSRWRPFGRARRIHDDVPGGALHAEAALAHRPQVLAARHEGDLVPGLREAPPK